MSKGFNVTLENSHTTLSQIIGSRYSIVPHGPYTQRSETIVLSYPERDEQYPGHLVYSDDGARYGLWPFHIGNYHTLSNDSHYIVKYDMKPVCYTHVRHLGPHAAQLEEDDFLFMDLNLEGQADTKGSSRGKILPIPGDVKRCIVAWYRRELGKINADHYDNIAGFQKAAKTIVDVLRRHSAANRQPSDRLAFLLVLRTMMQRREWMAKWLELFHDVVVKPVLDFDGLMNNMLLEPRFQGSKILASAETCPGLSSLHNKRAQLSCPAGPQCQGLMKKWLIEAFRKDSEAVQLEVMKKNWKKIITDDKLNTQQDIDWEEFPTTSGEVGLHIDAVYSDSEDGFESHSDSDGPLNEAESFDDKGRKAAREDAKKSGPQTPKYLSENKHAVSDSKFDARPHMFLKYYFVDPNFVREVTELSLRG